MKKPIILIAVILSAVLCTRCADTNSFPDEAVKQGYPKLYEAVFNRSYEQIIPFTNHSSEIIRQQAWRSLAQTPIDSTVMGAFISKVKAGPSNVSWFALSIHKLTPKQRRGLQQYWVETPDQRSGINLVLGRQGDEKTQSFLLKHLEEATGSDYEKAFALAVGRLMLEHPVKPGVQIQIIKNAFASGQPETTLAWLYGFYRGDVGNENKKVRKAMYNEWKVYGIGKNARVDQYTAEILGEAVFTEMVHYYDSTGTLKKEIQLGVELAQSLKEIPLTPQNKEAVKVLLLHPNPHVVQLTLAALKGKMDTDGELISFIESEIIKHTDAKPFVTIQAFETIASVKPDILKNYSTGPDLAKEHPYRLPQFFRFIMEFEEPETFLQTIASVVSEKGQLQSLFAIQALGSFWNDLKNKAPYRDEVRAILFDALDDHDYSVTFASQQLLLDSLLVNTNDFKRINTLLSYFELPRDMEIYQTFGYLYKERFEEQAKSIIDSLAALGYAPLNRSLHEAGWEVPSPEEVKTGFREPDWNRLWELGKHPVWVLETEKGVIKIKMNTLSAPATVSAIDSLTRAGAYNGVPFHRVVPNFVIQGGDIAYATGYGGPEFVIPTEPSETGFVRGAVGIASAGTDTEGSQYFIMHQWSPHLNGRYTLFGHVISGMDVVDRIVEGDMVEKAYWE